MTLTRRIIPCLDVADGRVVKGLHFESIRDAGDPVSLAKKYSDEGADELVFLDITASQQGRKTMTELVKKIAKVIDIPFTVGGGISSPQHARDILLSGADKVAINTGAIKNPQIVTDLSAQFGRQCIVVAIDAKKNRAAGGKNTFGRDGEKFWFEVFSYGGRTATSLDAIEWAKRAQDLGAGEILLTSIDRDGTKDGYDTLLTSEIVRSVSVPVIASGGCGSPEHMAEIFERSGVDAALAASIFHYDSHGIAATKRLLRERKIPVRL